MKIAIIKKYLNAVCHILHRPFKFWVRPTNIRIMFITGPTTLVNEFMITQFRPCIIDTEITETLISDIMAILMDWRICYDLIPNRGKLFLLSNERDSSMSILNFMFKDTFISLLLTCTNTFTH